MYLCYIFNILVDDNQLCKVVEKNPYNYWVPHKDCTKFYMCQNLGSNKWKAHVFQCAGKTEWDDQIKTCNHLRNLKKKNKECSGKIQVIYYDVIRCNEII